MEDLVFCNPFEKGGSWWKGNTHLHTTNFEGKVPPEEACRLYRNAGYHFVCLTDHGRVTVVESPDRSCLAVPGVELAYHVVSFNHRETEVFDQTGLSIQEVIDRACHAESVVILGHPYWTG